MEIYVVVGGFIFFDVVTGLMKALCNEGLNSTKLREGGMHKLSELMALLCCSFMELACSYIQLGVSIPVTNAAAIYICAMEVVSIMENICVMNPEMGTLFKPYLEKLKGKNNETK